MCLSKPQYGSITTLVQGLKHMVGLCRTWSRCAGAHTLSQTCLAMAVARASGAKELQWSQRCHIVQGALAKPAGAGINLNLNLPGQLRSHRPVPSLAAAQASLARGLKWSFLRRY